MIPQELGDSPVLVDTDVFSDVVWQREPGPWYAPFLDNRQWVLSFATVGELRHGALKARWGGPRRAVLEQRMRLCVVYPGNANVADRWAELALRYHQQIGANDLWTAACALANEPALPIATRDAAFSRIGAEFGISIIRHNAG